MLFGIGTFEKPHILVIESDPGSRESIQNYLNQGLGFPCTIWSSISECQSYQDLEKYNLIFIDADPPKCQGVEFLKKFDFSQMKTIVITLVSQLNPHLFEELIHLGGYDYIIKPINFLELKTKIIRALHGMGLFRQLIQKNKQLEDLTKNILENHDELETRTAEMNVEREILRSELDGYKQMVENAVDMIFSIDAEGRIESVNKIMHELSGYSYEEILYKNISCFIHPDYIPRVQNALGSVLETGVIKGIELMLTTKTKVIVSAEMNAVARYDYLGNFIGLWAILRDITERKRLEDELKELSIIDCLTKLYNKRYFLEILEKEIYRARRQKYPLSLVMIDLDKFKLHNDTYGHLAGDKVLAKVGEMLRCQVRSGVDAPCRYGGDEFTVILPQVGCELANQIAHRYQKAWEDDKEEDISFSIGISQYDGHSNQEEFIKKADEAMYQSKRTGGNKITFLD